MRSTLFVTGQLARVSALLLFSSALLKGGESSPRAAFPEIASAARPTLDQMAGDWIPMQDVANPPAVHNFHDMLLAGRDLTSVFCYPEDWLWAGSPRRGYPPVTLTLDGREFSCVDYRWYAYRALRRNLDCNGLSVESDTRMINEQRAVLVRVRISNPGTAPREIAVALSVPGVPHQNGVAAINTTQRKGFVTVVCPVQRPAIVVTNDGRVSWQWQARLASGAEQVLEFVAGDGREAAAASVARNVVQWARDFDRHFAGFKNVWEQRWADAFTPGNRHFSGNLPVLSTDNAELTRNYYMGVLTMLILERTQFPVHPRSFITSGEREPGTQYYWDASMQTTAWALLEPAGMKATLRRWLVQNARSGSTIDIRQTNGFDARRHDKITGYAFNACTIFKTADEYLRVTGDRAFLGDKLEDGRTVLQSLDAFATDWESLPKGPRGLANYGENNNLLECAPAYIHCVPSCNAQNVWMMRRAAQWHAVRGNSARAKELQDKAAAFLPSVLGLYKPSLGVWNAYHGDGTPVELRHCVDFIYAGSAVSDDLTSAQRREMITFVNRELLMRDWMRAMSLQDAAAARSDRPDHGPMGAFDGWVPLTIATTWRLGDPAGAYEFYRRTAVVTKEGPFAQAREFYGPNKKAHDAPVRVAERDGCMKECISGAAFADVVINTFFGFSPSPDAASMLSDPQTPRPFRGTLIGVRHRGQLHDLAASDQGIRITSTSADK